jgi:hypothetical protein
MSAQNASASSAAKLNPTARARQPFSPPASAHFAVAVFAIVADKAAPSKA